jgi:hypothetical protein
MNDIIKAITYQCSWDSIVNTVTTISAGQYRVPILVEATDFSLLQNIHSGLLAYPAS